MEVFKSSPLDTSPHWICSVSLLTRQHTNKFLISKRLLYSIQQFSDSIAHHVYFYKLDLERLDSDDTSTKSKYSYIVTCWLDYGLLCDESPAYA